jgi:hypothetical protein
MDSSFLTGLHAALGLYSGILFLKLIVVFGMPNHPLKLTATLVSFCACFYFSTKALVDFNLVGPWFWMRYRTLPVVAGGLALLLQTVTLVGDYGNLQLKAISRIPVMGSLLCLAFFNSKADILFGLTIFAGSLFLVIAGRKTRHQTRLFLKMSLFLALYGLLQLPAVYWLHVLSMACLFIAMFYFNLFEHTFGIRALVDQLEGSET